MHRIRGKKYSGLFSVPNPTPSFSPDPLFLPIKINENQGVFPKILPSLISRIHSLKRALAKK